MSKRPSMVKKGMVGLQAASSPFISSRLGLSRLLLASNVKSAPTQRLMCPATSPMDLLSSQVTGSKRAEVAMIQPPPSYLQVVDVAQRQAAEPKASCQKT